MKTHIFSTIYQRLLTGAALAAACLLLAGFALANTVTVTTTADSGPGSLREAIAAAANNGTVNFASNFTGTITLTTGELGIGRNLNIIGPGAAILSISGNNSNRVFNINSANARVIISGLTITGGRNVGDTNVNSNGQGGGVCNSGLLTMVGCKIAGNWSIGADATEGFIIGGDGLGGGIFSSGSLTLAECTLENNSAIGGSAYLVDSAIGCGSASGGAVYLSAGSMVNCTIANNSSFGGDGDTGSGISGGSVFGGGIYVNGLDVLLTGCTLSGNSGTTGSGDYSGVGEGGGVYCSQGILTFQSTIVSGNNLASGDGIQGGITGPDVYGSVTNGSFNLIGLMDGSTGWNTSGPGTDLTGTISAPLDPLLGPLQDNGGPTPTMALMPGSAAIDQGNSFGFATDQTGKARPFDCYNIPNAAGGDGSDIGAVEFYASRIPIVMKPRPSGLVFSYTNNSPGTKEQARLPIFGLQTLRGGLSPYAGAWEDFTNPVRLINNMFVAHEQIAVGSNDSAFYRLFGPMTNIPFIPPAATEPAAQITTSSATLNGTTIPVGNNTKYWFQFGGDTNYGLTTLTNQLNTSANPASLSYSYGGLSPLTTYHFQLVVVDDDGTQYGGDQSFTTKGLLPMVASYSIQDGEFGLDYVVLEGTINAEGTPALAYFEYGLTTSYGMQTPNFYTQNSYDTEVFTNKIYFEGLVTNTFYHFRAVGFNGTGKGVGADETFYTSGL